MQLVNAFVFIKVKIRKKWKKNNIHDEIELKLKSRIKLIGFFLVTPQSLTLVFF